MNLNKQTKVQTMPTFSEKKNELDTDDTLAGFNPKTQYAIKKLKAKYPQADNLLSALLADVEKNEDDDDSRHDMNKKHIQGLEKKLMDVIRKNGLKEEAMIVESLKENDLRGLVSPSITIDQYKSKLGKDEKIIVAGFRVKDQDPAKDLSQFIESSLNDDILDVEGDTEIVGKAVGKDINAGKATFVSLLGLETAKVRAQALADEACDALVVFGDRASILKKVAQFVVSREK